MSTQPTESGGREEFTTFMRAYQNMVFSTAARLAGNDAQAEDIAQDVFIKAYEHFADLRDSASAGGWLKTVATNLALNHLNRYRKRWRMFSELSTGSDGESDSDADPALELTLPVPDTLLAELGAEQRRALIDGALQRLPDHQRLPLVLYHFDEYSYEQIAAHLRVSLAKVKTDIRRARAALLPMLASGGVVRGCLND